MSETDYTAPKIGLSAFHCPHCSVFSNQRWSSAHTLRGRDHLGEVNDFYIAHCLHCRKDTFWVDDRMVYPCLRDTPSLNKDLPEDIQQDYEEASSIMRRSPRSAAALFRFCMRDLIHNLGENSEQLDVAVDLLLNKGLNPVIAKGLRTARVIGEHAIPAGVLHDEDTAECAMLLCKLINMIADSMITQPKILADLCEDVSEAK